MFRQDRKRHETSQSGECTALTLEYYEYFRKIKWSRKYVTNQRFYKVGIDVKNPIFSLVYLNINKGNDFY